MEVEDNDIVKSSGDGLIQSLVLENQDTGLPTAIGDGHVMEVNEKVGMTSVNSDNCSTLPGQAVLVDTNNVQEFVDPSVSHTVSDISKMAGQCVTVGEAVCFSGSQLECSNQDKKSEESELIENASVEGEKMSTLSPKTGQVSQEEVESTEKLVNELRIVQDTSSEANAALSDEMKNVHNIQTVHALVTAPEQQSGTDYTDIQSPEAYSPRGDTLDDREDISDIELDHSSETAELDTHKSKVASDPKLGKTVNTKAVFEHSETRSSSVSDKEIIDLKLEEMASKSDEGSLNDGASKHSKVVSEDLEAVSDDELPDHASHNQSSHVLGTKTLIEGGEDVSSDEGDMHETSVNSLHNKRFANDRIVGSIEKDSRNSIQREQRELVSPTAFPESVSSLNDLSEPVSPTALPNLPEPVSPAELHEPVSPTAFPEGYSDDVEKLAPLEAEPISDEEDNTGLGDPDEEEGEAGEIKSPTEDITSPPSSPEQSGAILGEVEPVSADDSNDTDGELPSDDEKKFESIESDEEGDLRGVGADTKKSTDGYMESISDDEVLDDRATKTKKSSSKLNIGRKFGDGHLSADKAAVPSNFNEHQVELDYEENEADDGETKPEVGSIQPLKEDGEEGELDEKGAGSDKDEGELSDDDCEEGEIKEPGSRKPFVKPMCRFFQRGHCTWGINCRFLHPGVNDKGYYQMIEIPGFQPSNVHARIGPWPEPQPPPQDLPEIPPPPMPDTPPPETAWERGLRIAKEQRKRATERRQKEPDFEDKRLNLSVDEDRDVNKENDRIPKIIPKDPYYDQQAYEEDEYYKITRDPWQAGRYDNFEMRYHKERSYSPPPPMPYHREKHPPMPMPPSGYRRQYSPPPPTGGPPVDKFGRDRDRNERREEPSKPKPADPPAPVRQEHPSPSPTKRPDEWIDPWRRQTARKSPTSPVRTKTKRSRSRGRRSRRSVSDSSDSSRSGSGSSSGSSRSSYSGSSSSSRSRSPEPAPPGVDQRHNDRNNQLSPSRDQPRSSVSVRGRGGGRGGPHQHDRDGNRRGDQPGYGRSRDGGPHEGGWGNNFHHRGGYQGRGGRGGGHFDNYRGRGGRGGWVDYQNRGGDFGRGRSGHRDDGRDGRPGYRDDQRMKGRPRVNSPPGRPLPYKRPRPRSGSSSSSSRSGSGSRSGSHSRSRSRSPRGRGKDRSGGRGKNRYSSSGSSSGSSSSRSSSSSSGGSADSDHLYRDLSPGGARDAKKKRPGVTNTRGGAPPVPQGRTAPPPPQGRTAPPVPQGRTAPPVPQGRTAPPVPQGKTAPPPPQGRTAPPVPQGRTAPPVPQGRTAPPVPQGRVAPMSAPIPPPLSVSTQRHSSASSSATSTGRQPQQNPLEQIPIPGERSKGKDPRDTRDRTRDGREGRERRDSTKGSRDPSMTSAACAPGSRSESRYASRNAPQAPVKPTDPMKAVGQKSNIKLTLLPKQQQPNLNVRPNPLDSPPHGSKRRMSDRESPPISAPASKRLNLPMPPSAAALRVATEKASKLQQRHGRPNSPPSAPMPVSSMHIQQPSLVSGVPPPSMSSSKARAPVSPQKQLSSGVKSRGQEPSLAKTAPKLLSMGGGTSMSSMAASAPSLPPSSAGVGAAAASKAKVKKSMSSRREELLKQLKAVEDAISRKKTKLP